MNLNDYIKSKFSQQVASLQARVYELEFMVYALKEENEALKREKEESHAESVHEDHLEK